MKPLRYLQIILLATRLLGLSSSAQVTSTERQSWQFDFGSGETAEGFAGVTSKTVFSLETGFGLEPGGQAIDKEGDGADAIRSDSIGSDKAFRFSVVVPEGNYRVAVTFGDSDSESETTVKAETRRLMGERVATAAGEFVARDYIVNVRNSTLTPPETNAPGGSAVVLNERESRVLHWDEKLTLEFCGEQASVCAVEIEAVDVPTVFLVGDSTVTDQPREGSGSWGQMLTRFLKPEVAVANHAESGETMKSFISGLRLAKVLSFMKAGDYLFIQFAHNDSKKQWPQTYVEAHTTYKAYLKVFIEEARLRGATPVLVTSVQRRQFTSDGHIRNSHGDYPDAMREVAKEEGVALIDLEKMSIAFYEALGPDKAPLAFAGNGRDATHHNNYGAYELAKCVVQGIRDAGLPLTQFITADFTGFDPSRPDPVESFSIAASQSGPARVSSADQASNLPSINAALPTIFVAGDSTAARGSGEDQTGWAEPFVGYFDSAKVNIVNRARGGRSSRTFITEGLWDQLMKEVKPGDIVLVQFGHNDGGAINDERRARGSRGRESRLYRIIRNYCAALRIPRPGESGDSFCRCAYPYF